MRAPIIVNESSNPTDVGCIYVFSSAVLAERYFERWYADESYFACDVDGLPLLILPCEESDHVKIVELVDCPARPDLASLFLRSYLGSLVLQKKTKNLDISDQWLRSASVDEIAAAGLRHAIE